MTQQTKNYLGDWFNINKSRESVEKQFDSRPMPFKSLRLFPIHRFVAVCIVSICFAMTLSHFLTREILQHDSDLTGKFVSNIVSGHGQQVELVKILDERTDLIRFGIGMATAEAVRNQFYDHLKYLPDMLHVKVYASDRKIIWASDPDLIGKVDKSNDELSQVISSREMVSTDSLNQASLNDLEHKFAQFFIVNPQEFFVENYIPLFDDKGSVIAVVDIYKEPKSLFDTIRHGYLLVWLSTALTVFFLYFAKYWINRRSDQAVEEQLQLLFDFDSKSTPVDISAAVTNGIRKPLTLISTNDQLGRVSRTG